ncbi:MAG: Gfo/Idh/MocA family oxidoreductase [Acidobacteria bacterium]|nr:Gfo/Idh/MocA family oxidoreductase [Acidobacteriota bacterium]
MSSSDSRPLGVATIGHAFMGKAHSNAWRNVGKIFDVPQYNQVVLVGRDQARTLSAAQHFGWAEASTDWRSVLERDDVDIVDICSPGWLHAEMAIAALEAGKHVLVEKPLANTVAEAEAMAAAAETAAAAGVLSMVGFTYRRVPALALARQLIADGALGEVRQVRASYLQDWLADPEAPLTWRLDRNKAGSGALGDIASHTIDQVQFLLGDTVREVSGRLHTFTPSRPFPDGSRRGEVTVDDAAWATLTMASGVVASVDVSRVALGRKNALQIEIYGTGGALKFDLERLNELEFFDRSRPIQTQGFSTILTTEPQHPYLENWWPQGHMLGWADSFTNQARDFLLNIATQTQPTPSFADGLAVQRVLAAIEESHAQRGTSIAVNQLPVGAS